MFDLVIAGGGVIGMSVAWRASAASLRVAVVDPGREVCASRVAVGLLLPAGGRISRRHLRLRKASADLFPGFVDELEEATGLSVGYRDTGMLTVGLGEGVKSSLAGLAGALRGLGVATEIWEAHFCREREPALTPQVGGGVFIPGAQVEPVRLLEALERACQAAGVERILGRGVEVLRENGRACGLRLEDGLRVEAGKVVLAAGFASGEVLGLPEALPVYPVKGQVVHLRAPGRVLGMGLQLFRESLYLVDRGDGRLVVGATEEQAGDTTCTAGAVRHLLDQARRLVPSLEGFALVRTMAGLRPKLEDGLPVIGASSLSGLVIATGHYRNGILLAPITARAALELLEGKEPAWLSPFSPQRSFSRRRVGYR